MPARPDDQAQPPTVLSRDFAHVIRRHASVRHRGERCTGNLLAAWGLALSGAQCGGNARRLLTPGSPRCCSTAWLDGGVRGLEVIENVPASVDGRDCHRIDYTFRNGSGLQNRSVG